MPKGMVWVFDPGRGGTKVTPLVKARTEQRVRAYIEKHYAGRYSRIDVRFRGCFCYVDAYREPKVPKRMPKWATETKAQYLERLRSTPWPLCRLRYRHLDFWGLDLFVYSSEKYETSIYRSGRFYGTPEEALEIAADFHLGTDW